MIINDLINEDIETFEHISEKIVHRIEEANVLYDEVMTERGYPRHRPLARMGKVSWLRVCKHLVTDEKMIGVRTHTGVSESFVIPVRCLAGPPDWREEVRTLAHSDADKMDAEKMERDVNEEARERKLLAELLEKYGDS